MWFIFTYLRCYPQNEKCYRQHEKQFAVSGLKSFAINNMMLWRNAENFLANFSEAIKITCDDDKVGQEVVAHLWSLPVSQPTPDYSHCQAHRQEAFAQRYLCLPLFLLLTFPLSCSICHFQWSFGLDLIPTTIHTWNIKWVDYKMNWKLASISSIALRISWLCFVSANFLSAGSSTTGLGPTPGSFGW